MSRNVDFSKPLSAEDQAYLHMRGRVSDLDRQTATEDLDVSGDGTGPQYRPVLQGEAAAARKQQLLDELAAIAEGEAAEAGRDGSVEDGDVDPYEVWSPDELTKELKRRELTHTGSKADKVARLYEDDAKATGDAVDEQV